MIAGWIDYLLHGSDELYLPHSWLVNTARIGNYVGYTRRQHEQGSVVRDTAATARDRFWQRVEAKRQPAGNVATFRKQAR